MEYHRWHGKFLSKSNGQYSTNCYYINSSYIIPTYSLSKNSGAGDLFPTLILDTSKASLFTIARVSNNNFYFASQYYCKLYGKKNGVWNELGNINTNTSSPQSWDVSEYEQVQISICTISAGSDGAAITFNDISVID